MRHGLFVLPENLAQCFYLLIHAVKELLDRVHAEFAAFVAVQRETDGHVLGQAEQHRFVRLLRRRLRRESGEVFLQIERRAGRRPRGSVRLGADLEHERNLPSSAANVRSVAIAMQCFRCIVGRGLALFRGIPTWARSISAPASRASKIRCC